MSISRNSADAAAQLHEESRAIAAIARAHDESIRATVHRLAGHVHPAGVAASRLKSREAADAPAPGPSERPRESPAEIFLKHAAVA